jgi:hypothetical protein
MAVQSSAHALSELKLKLITRFGSLATPPRAQRDGFVAPGLGAPIPKGKVIGITGKGRTTFVIELLKHNPQGCVAWLRSASSEDTLFPTSLAQRSAKLGRVVFLKPQTTFLSQAMIVVQSQLFSFVVIEIEKIIEKDHRRLLLGAKRSGCGVFVLSSKRILTLQHQISVSSSQHLVLERTKAGVLEK